VLSSLITHRARPRQLLVAAAVYAPLAAAIFAWPGFVALVSRRCGLPPFDVRGFWDSDDASTLVNACGDTGRTAYLRLEIADLAYPAALGWLLLVASALLLRRFGGRTWPVLLPIVAMTLLDYVENVGVWTILLRWPEVNTVVVGVAGLATAIKRILGFIAFSTPVVLGIIELVHRGRQRMDSRRQPVADFSAINKPTRCTPPHPVDTPSTTSPSSSGKNRPAGQPDPF
jgi:hypothetical protein